MAEEAQASVTVPAANLKYSVLPDEVPCKKRSICQDTTIFDKLPDEVLGLILPKLSPKCLFVCSFISKDFIYNLFQRRQSLSLQLPSSGPSSVFIPNRLLPSEYKPPHYCIFNDALLRFLTKFVSRLTSIQTLHIELSCECPKFAFTPNHRFSWDFKLGHNLKTFAILSNVSIEKIDEAGNEAEKTSRLYDREYLNWEKAGLKGYAYWIHQSLLLLVSRHPNIESVDIVDSGKHGKVSLQGEQLVKLKNNMSKSMPPLSILEQRENSISVPGHYFTVWHVPELELPRSGLLMKRVTLGIGAEDMFSSDFGDGIKGLAKDFGDGIFGEALSEILTHDYISSQKSSYIVRSLNDSNSWQASLWATSSLINYKLKAPL